MTIAAADTRWSSRGMAPRDGIRAWQDWAAQTIAPIDVSVADGHGFAAGWRSYGLGELRLLHLDAPAQRVVHRGTGSTGGAAPAIQLVYARRGAMKARTGGAPFMLRPGQFVLLDNMRFYEMEMDAPHEAIDVMMPRAWIDRFVRDSDALLARPLSARAGRGAPLGRLIETIAAHPGDSMAIRPLLAERIGALLALAEEPGGADRGEATEHILGHIRGNFADPDLSLPGVAAAMGISTRQIQVPLAARGTTFLDELAAARLDRAAGLLRGGDGAIGEIAFRCGFLDPGYFARRFRRRFGVSPGAWRRSH